MKTKMRAWSVCGGAVLKTAALALVAGALGLLGGVTVARAASANSLSSVSVRTAVGTGDSALLSSFTIEGAASKQVLVRAAGPALTAFGISGAMADPVLTVHDSAGKVVASSDNWDAGLAGTFMSVGAFPFSAASKDAATLATLAPGTYTARVTGAGGTSGSRCSKSTSSMRQRGSRMFPRERWRAWGAITSSRDL